MIGADENPTSPERATSPGVQAAQAFPEPLGVAFENLRAECERHGGCFVVVLERHDSVWSASHGTYARTFGLIEYLRESLRFNLHRSLSREPDEARTDKTPHKGEDGD